MLRVYYSLVKFIWNCSKDIKYISENEFMVRNLSQYKIVP